MHHYTDLQRVINIALRRRARIANLQYRMAPEK